MQRETRSYRAPKAFSGTKRVRLHSAVAHTVYVQTFETHNFRVFRGFLAIHENQASTQNFRNSLSSKTASAKCLEIVIREKCAPQTFERIRYVHYVRCKYLKDVYVTVDAQQGEMEAAQWS